MSELRFRSKEHKQFFQEMLERSRYKDCNHQSFFYCVGISESARTNIDRLFDFQRDRIKTDGLHDGWQTGGTIRLTRLAFNLMEGYVEKGKRECIHRMNCSTAGMHLTFSMQSDCGIRITAGIFPAVVLTVRELIETIR